MSTPSPVVGSTSGRRNQLLYTLFSRHEYDRCMALADQILESDVYTDHDYAMYIKGLLLRLRGEVVESLKLFQRALERDPQSVDFMKQVGRYVVSSSRCKARTDSPAGFGDVTALAGSPVPVPPRAFQRGPGGVRGRTKSKRIGLGDPALYWDVSHESQGVRRGAQVPNGESG